MCDQFYRLETNTCTLPNSLNTYGDQYVKYPSQPYSSLDRSTGESMEIENYRPDQTLIHNEADFGEPQVGQQNSQIGQSNNQNDTYIYDVEQPNYIEEPMDYYVEDIQSTLKVENENFIKDLNDRKKSIYRDILGQCKTRYIHGKKDKNSPTAIFFKQFPEVDDDQQNLLYQGLETIVQKYSNLRGIRKLFWGGKLPEEFLSELTQATRTAFHSYVVKYLNEDFISYALSHDESQSRAYLYLYKYILYLFTHENSTIKELTFSQTEYFVQSS